MKRIHPILIMTAPVLILVSCAQHRTNTRQSERTLSLQQASNPPATSVVPGRTLFLKNCAHCHGADAHGDEGPDLHNLDWTDQQIAKRIRNGKAGQMTAFAGKLDPSEIDSLVAYVRSLK
jgi:mono/diheme cytochrome c family protein